MPHLIMDSHSLLGARLHVVLPREHYVHLQQYIHQHNVLLNGQHFIEEKKRLIS